jgi:hypothetical protein
VVGAATRLRLHYRMSQKIGFVCLLFCLLDSLKS